jgi:Icc-related predicted phosphoesterase
MSNRKDTVRVAAVADIHYGKASQGVLQPLLGQINAAADVLLLGGDLTDYGLPEEAQALAKELTAAVKIPIVAVLGNHDYESGKQGEVSRTLADAGVRVLDGDACEVRGIGFAGVKGFVGGFGRRILTPWGEPAIKQLVHEAIQEALKLEAALSRLRTPHRVALLHYSPIQATVEGEPPEIFPFMGCSRLEEPLNRYPVDVVFHGHAHHGRPEGRTQGNIPVFNVAHSLLGRHFPDRPPFHVHEFAPAEPAAASA